MKNYNQTHQKKTGVVIEIKDYDFYKSEGVNVAPLVIQLLKDLEIKENDPDFPIIVHSFDFDSIKYMKENSNYQLS